MASDHRGRDIHAGKRTAQERGSEPVAAYRKTPKKKGPGGAGVTKGY